MRKPEQEKVFSQMGQQGKILKTPNMMLEELYRNLPKALMIINQNQYVEGLKREQSEDTLLIDLLQMKDFNKRFDSLVTQLNGVFQELGKALTRMDCSKVVELPVIEVEPARTLQQLAEEVAEDKKKWEEYKKQKEAEMKSNQDEPKAESAPEPKSDLVLPNSVKEEGDTKVE